jgi:hypothetical protein
MGLWDMLTNAFTGQPAQDAAQKNQQLYQQNLATGTQNLNNAWQGAQGAYGQAAGAYDPLAQFGRQFQPGMDMYFNSLGLNGAGGNDAATGAFQAGPGYNWMRDQALEGVTRGAAARSMGGLGGNTLAALSDRSGQMANQEFGNWQSRLAGLLPYQASATAGAAAGRAGAYTGLAGAGMTHGLNLANLGNIATGNMANTNMAAAQAQQQGSQNLWGLASSLANPVASWFGGQKKQTGYGNY